MSTTHQEKHRLSGALRGSGSKWKVEIFSLGTCFFDFLGPGHELGQEF